MSVASINGEFGIAPQVSKIGSGTFTPASYNWRRYRVPQLDLGMREVVQPFPMEISGFMTPTGIFKSGVFYGGTFDMLPRTEGVTGFLLYALMGNVSSVTGEDMDANAVTGGMYTHIFNYNAANSIPWFATRYKVPNLNASDILGNYGYDCHVNAAQFRMSAAGKLTSRFSIIGRGTQLEENPTFSWVNSFEDETSVPEACTGSVSIGGLLPAVLSMQVDVVNTLTGPQQEFIFGSYFLDDIIPLARAITVRVLTKWNDPNLYQLAVTNSQSGTAWSSTPYITEALGPGNANGFLLRADSPKNVTGTSPLTKNGFAIRGNRVHWVKDGDPSMQAGNVVVQAFTATIVTPSNTAQDYAEIILQNGTNGYLWS